MKVRGEEVAPREERGIGHNDSQNIKGSSIEKKMEPMKKQGIVALANERLDGCLPFVDAASAKGRGALIGVRLQTPIT